MFSVGHDLNFCVYIDFPRITNVQKCSVREVTKL